MNIKHFAAAALTAGTALTGLLGTGAAHAATAPRPAVVHPDGYATVAQCTGVSGAINFTPGLDKYQRKQTAVLSATLSGCSAFSTGYSDTGSLSATLTGKASKSAQTLSGSFVINWPASSGLNPSVGSITLNLANGQVSLTGSTSTTAGAFEGAYLQTGYLPIGHTGLGTKAHPITQQTFVNTLPLTLSENFG